MKAVIIGAGNMGGAIARNLAAGGYMNARDLTIVDPSREVCRDFALRGCDVANEVSDESLHGAEMVLLTVKPWLVGVVAEQVNRALQGNNTAAIVSVAAGVTLDDLAAVFGTRALFRVMPNTAAAVAQSMTFVASRNAGESACRRVGEMFESLGMVSYIDESRMEASMALASCGIAYALRYVRAAMEGAVELGIPAAESQKIICQTLRGAVTLLESVPGAHPETEIDKVTTPGGITIRGLNAMEQNGFSNAVIQGLKASVK